MHHGSHMVQVTAVNRISMTPVVCMLFVCSKIVTANLIEAVPSLGKEHVTRSHVCQHISIAVLISIQARLVYGFLACKHGG